MVNFGLNSAAILGIFLAVAGAGLYFLRSVRPELARDQDIFFAAVGVLCGGILLTQGWRLDPILQFGQFLLTGSTVFFAYEAIRLRGIATEQAKRKTPIVDDERPVSSVYRYDQEAELYDQLEPEEERYIKPRLRGTDDPRTRTRERYEGETRRPKSRPSSERLGSGERTPKRRPRPTSRPSERPVDSWDANLDSDWEEKPSRNSRPRPSRPENQDPEVAPRQRKRRPSQKRVSSPSSRDVEAASTDYRDRDRTYRDRDVEATPADYVDYQPIDSPEEDGDNSGRFDY